MKRVAIFGNAGSGKSALATQLAAITGLPLHVIDKMQFNAGGDAAPHEEYLREHADLIDRDTWIIDGYGGAAPAWERFARADTLVHIDPPIAALYRNVTMRFIKGIFSPVPGWPPRSPLWSSTRTSYQVIPKCYRNLTPKYRKLVADMAASKRTYHLQSRADVAAFIAQVERETVRS